MNEVKVSICIPVYNGSEFIGQTIDSVLKQTFTDFELLIIDNCSTDNTLDIVKSYTDSRVKIHQNQTNIGMVPNWNRALELAKGNYIKILPADDLIYPDCLQLQCEVLDKDTDKKISLVCGRKHIINDAGKILFSRGFANTEKQVDGFEAINATIRAGGNIIGEGGALLFRTEIIKKAGAFSNDIFYALDLDYWFRILLHGNLYVLFQVVSAFRISTSSESTKIVDTQKRDNLRFTKKIYDDKRFKVSWLNYRIGLFKVVINTQVKKLIYKFVLK